MDDLFPEDAEKAEKAKRARLAKVSEWIRDCDNEWRRKAVAKDRRANFMLVIGDKL